MNLRKKFFTIILILGLLGISSCGLVFLLKDLSWLFVAIFFLIVMWIFVVIGKVVTE